MVITVCIGSGCHVKGSRRIIEILQQLIAAQPVNVQMTLKLEACFCQGKCTEGVVVKFDDTLISGVSTENIRELFHEKAVEGAKI